MIEWQDLHHSELSVSQLYALLQLRCAVFVVEQNCPYQDIDGDDLTGDNRHILAKPSARPKSKTVFSKQDRWCTSPMK